MIKLVTMITLCTAITSMKITDLEDRPLALFKIGQMKMRTGTLKIIHVIEIQKIKNLFVEITNKFKLLEQDNNIIEEIDRMEDLISRITPYPTRMRRWDFLGKIHKWFTGSPDADDLRYIEKNLNELKANDNLQIRINQEVTDKVNEISRMINYQTTNDPNWDQLYLINQLRELKEKIEAVQDAITLAKKQIVSHKLLTLPEIHLLAENLIKAGIRINIPEQALNFVNPTIGVDRNTIHYILTVPRIKTTTYHMYRVEPIIKRGEIVDLPTQIYATNFPEVLAVFGECKKFNDLYLCNRNEVKHVKKDECVGRILFSGKATCQFKKSPNDYNRIIEISSSTILINNEQVSIKDEFINKNISGSYVIEYNNETISLNGKKFTNHVVHTKDEQSIFKATWRPNVQKKIIETLKISNLKEIKTNPAVQSDLIFWALTLPGTPICVIIIAGLCIMCNRGR